MKKKKGVLYIKIIIALFMLILIRTFLTLIPFISWSLEYLEFKIGLAFFRFISNPITLLSCVIVIIVINVFLIKKKRDNLIIVEVLLLFISLFLIYQGYRISILFDVGLKLGIEISSYYQLNQKLPENLDIIKNNFTENELLLIKYNFKYSLDYGQSNPQYSYSLELNPIFIKHHYYLYKPWSKEFIIYD